MTTIDREPHVSDSSSDPLGPTGQTPGELLEASHNLKAKYAAGGEQEPALTECPSWCRSAEQYPKVKHDWASQDRAGHPSRGHVVEYGALTPSGPSYRLSDVFVAMEQQETVVAGQSTFPPVQIALAAEHYPHLTAGEARQVAAWLVAAADRLDEIQAER